MMLSFSIIFIISLYPTFLIAVSIIDDYKIVFFYSLSEISVRDITTQFALKVIFYTTGGFILTLNPPWIELF
ncbi:MAG: hypothetical protein COB66_06030 [Coxiella sp. (in: Bacteria)]|nr:MAG: hypothetical protein COB66_06030 [Coxiella sp. (in: g-proteobacteria)]